MGSMRTSQKTKPAKKQANDEVASASGFTLGASVDNVSDTAPTVNNDSAVDPTANNETGATQIETNAGHSIAQPNSSYRENNVASSAAERFESAGMTENDPLGQDQDDGQATQHNQLNDAGHSVLSAVQETDDSINDISLHIAAPGHNIPNPIQGVIQLHMPVQNNPPFPIPDDEDRHVDQDNLPILGVHLRRP